MEEAAYAAEGLDWRYLTIREEKDDLAAAVKGALAMGFRGFNLTIPHKVAVLPLLDELSPAAKISGAVNTVVVKDGKLSGDNTDGKGWLTSLEDAGVKLSGAKVVILGAGGAARALAVESALAGARKVVIVNRTESRGKELAALVAEKTPAEAEYLPWTRGLSIPGDTDILANATSIGLYPHVDEKPPINYDALTSGMVVSDVIFNDPHSLFLGEAEKRGAHTINGLGMLVNQGAINFKLWTGIDAPLSVMTGVLKREFGLK
jgi:shikimate dehydrogenase